MTGDITVLQVITLLRPIRLAHEPPQKKSDCFEGYILLTGIAITQIVN